jgi:hypothetical protein
MVIGISIFTLIMMASTLAALQIASTQIGNSVQPQFAAAAESAQKIITAPLQAQTVGIAALLGAGLFIAIVSSNWPSMVWARKKVRKALDWATIKIAHGWKGAKWLDWFALNRVVIAWTLVAVSFVLFAFRLPPTASGVKEALIMSTIVVIGLEIVASLSRVTRK